MKYLAVPCLSLLLAAACGDNHDVARDAAAQQLDAPASPADAKVCAIADTYPARIERLSVDLGHPFDLTLDGNGTRCEQIIRALTDADPTKRPPELAQLDVVGVTGTCTQDPDLDREIIRLRAPLYGGKPLYGFQVQDVLVHIGRPPVQPLIAMPATVVYLHGDFYAAGGTTESACYSGDEVAQSMAGRSLEFTKFNGCVLAGEGSYTIAADDVIETGDEGYYMDDGYLHRVRGVDVYLAPSHITNEVRQSDAYCCSPESEDHCVGQQLFIDVVTGELLGQMQHCHTC